MQKLMSTCRNLCLIFIYVQHKQRCVALEEQLVELVILAMERSESEVTTTVDGEDISNNHWLWIHLSSQLIYFVLLQFANFPKIVMSLHAKVIFRCN